MLEMTDLILERDTFIVKVSAIQAITYNNGNARIQLKHSGYIQGLQMSKAEFTKLKEEYKTKNLFLIFAEDYYNKTNITFEEYPKIFAKLRGFSTYFSEVEGFGNNLLEVLASVI